MHEMEVAGVRVELPMNAPVLVLREAVVGGRHLPIWIGAAEASAILDALEGRQPARPLTHDLTVAILGHLGHRLPEVRIVDLDDEGTFFATVVVDEAEISARPSDAIALAVRTGARILCADHVLAAAGVLVPGDAEAQVAEFRRFLDDLDVDDFSTGT